MPATGLGCIAVGSYTCRRKWACDDSVAEREEVRAVLGRASHFSASGPSRNGTLKPELCAPGEYVTAALALSSQYASLGDQCLKQQRSLTLAGTSMAAPVVTGALALCLQKKPTLTPAEARRILSRTARRDRYTGISWNPVYGAGKLDVAAALAALTEVV